MDGVRAITENINVFVQFFQSINALFCHVRWLEANLRNAPTGLLFIVGAIGCIAVIMYLAPGSDALAPIAIVIVVGVLLWRRWRDGPMRGASFERVMFGDPDDRAAEARHEDISARGLRDTSERDDDRFDGGSGGGKRPSPRSSTSSSSSSSSLSPTASRASYDREPHRRGIAGAGDVEMGPVVATAYPVDHYPTTSTTTSTATAASYSYPTGSSASGGAQSRVVPAAAVRYA
jgi:hypothetical protein